MKRSAPLRKQALSLLSARSEYFCQEKTSCKQGKVARQPRSVGLMCLSSFSDVGQRGFSLGGHRLSSLFRAIQQNALTLMLGKLLRFFLAPILKFYPIIPMSRVSEDIQ